MLGLVCAIGVLFASPNLENDPNNDYVLTPQGVVQIQEIDCNDGETQCRAQLKEDGPIYNVFDDPSLTTPKVGDGSVTQLY